MFGVLSFFPELYDWWYFTPFVFRIFLSYGLLREARRVLKNADPVLIRPKNTPPTVGARRMLVGVIGSLGVFLLVGLGVQIAGVITASMYLSRAYQLTQEGAPSQMEHYFLLSLVALSLIVLGPGPYAIDLPL